MHSAAPLEQATLRKVTRRLIPFLFLLYVLSYIDRINVSFAALQMNRDLGFSAAVYGLGAGVFFVGYVLLQVPSNLVLARIGARRWLAALTLAWGAIAAAMALVRGPASFYALRFLLGAAEAGFAPGTILYLTYWFPESARATAISRFMSSIPIAGVLAGPVSGALLNLVGRAGLAGWQWLFLVEGAPALALGLVALGYLTDRPGQAAWLSPDERAWLASRVTGAASGSSGAPRPRAAFASRIVWRLGFIWFLLNVGGYAFVLWLPQIIRDLSGFSDFMVGLASAGPHLAAAASMLVVGAHSDRSGERARHVAVPAAVGALGLAASGLLRSPVPGLAALTLTAVGIAGAFGPFWGLGTSLVGARAAASGIALINAVGNLAGFVGPYLVGLVKDATGGYGGALVALSVGLATAAGLALRLGGSQREVGAPPP